MDAAPVILWAVVAWIVLNALIVLVWTGVGRFANRAHDPARRGLRAEALFAAFAFLLIFGGGSLASPGVREAVKEAVFSATGLGASADTPGSTKPVEKNSPTGGTTAPIGVGGPSAPRPEPRPGGKLAGSGPEAVPPPPVPSPSPTDSPSPSPTDSPSPSPTDSPSPSPTDSPSPSTTTEPAA